MRKTILIAVIIAVVAAGGYGYYLHNKKEPPPTVTTAKVTRGDVAETVGATGQLQAVTTVQVGTQVSGTVQQLHADFNSLVHKGEVIARLDPSLFQTQIDQARANLLRAQADLDRLKVALSDAQTKLTRAQELYKQQLLSQVDLEAAQVAVQSADAQLKSQQAAVTQAQASLQQNQVNLEHTIITAPIDGLVISRNVDVGQTVASSLSAPTLFILAADLTKMQVLASLDESDIGRIRPGQLVRFRVDAYPNEEFTGSVTQLRLQPQTVQNVVTYSTVIDVPNPDLKLKPGMTANVNIEIAKRTNVLRVPNAALRFRPSAEIFEALGQTAPTTGGGAGGRGRREENDTSSTTESRAGGAQPPAATAAATNSITAEAAAAPQQRSREGRSSGQNGPTTTSDNAASGAARGRGTGPGGQSGRGTGPGGQNGGTAEESARTGFGGGRSNFQQRMANMTPEERQAFTERMRARGFDPDAFAGRQDGTNGRQGNGAQANSRTPGSGTPAASQSSPANNRTATTIDALFGPLPSPETFGQAWLFQDNKLVRVPLRLGVTDGQQTELIQGNLQEGEEIVTNVVTAAQRAATNAAGTAAPIFGRGGFPGGGGFGGGRGNPGGGGARGGR